MIVKLLIIQSFEQPWNPFFSNKGASTSKITLIENDKIVSEDIEVANALNTFFSESVKSLDITEPLAHMVDNTNIDDPIDAIILKYSNHPSILKSNHTIGTLHFSFHNVELIDVLTEINMLRSTTSSITYPLFFSNSLEILVANHYYLH